MILRDELESLLRGWDAYELSRAAPPVIDYDCAPGTTEPMPVTSRLDVLGRLTGIERMATADNVPVVGERARAGQAYARALLGETMPLDTYLRATQGAPAAGWTSDDVAAVGARARGALAALGIPWDADTEKALSVAEGPIETEDVADGMRAAAAEMEPTIRQLTGSNATYTLTVEPVNVDAYWTYWLDGAGANVRLRLNLAKAAFTRVRLKQFALHEILGHGLQFASWAATCAAEDVPWVRLSSVHAQSQILSEGLAQAWPLFACPDDALLTTRVRLVHYLQLVRAELHRAINAGEPVEVCAAHARARVPFWSDSVIADFLTDRGANPLLRSYLWSYPAGIDWFASLADHGDPETVEKVLRAAYTRPLTPADLADLWPAGPPIGGPGAPVHLRDHAIL